MKFEDMGPNDIQDRYTKKELWHLIVVCKLDTMATMRNHKSWLAHEVWLHKNKVRDYCEQRTKTLKRCECGGRLETWEDKCPSCQFEDGVPASEIDGAVDEVKMTEDYDGDWPPGAPVYK